jgi:hypothetical protein
MLLETDPRFIGQRRLTSPILTISISSLPISIAIPIAPSLRATSSE